ncbi:hypothetical protein [Brucella intermedia]|uniref:hypothetical protein n=1 Tax=Brucella intermedia TaxID=94625 RepID=UPI00224AF0E0|nr:hypothetical protein [Brucella intermedia]
MAKEYRTTPEAIERGREMGVYGDTEKRLIRMAARSAPVTHEYGNRRFQNFVLRVVGDLITDVTRVDFTAS